VSAVGWFVAESAGEANDGAAGGGTGGAVVVKLHGLENELEPALFSALARQ